MKEFEIDMLTPDGPMNTVVAHPDEGGPFPVAICFMDSCGVRPDFLDMARRLAVTGYCVVTPNLYHRRARDVDLDPDSIDFDETYEAGRSLMWELNKSITSRGFEADMQAMLDWADQYPLALNGQVGAYGYCLGGKLAVTAAAHFPSRVAAAASFHGGGMVEDDFSRVADIRAEVYLGHAGTDKYIPLHKIQKFDSRLREAGVRSRLEIYDEAHHGWTIAGRRVYHEASANRAWERLFSLFRRNLPQAALAS